MSHLKTVVRDAISQVTYDYPLSAEVVIELYETISAHVQGYLDNSEDFDALEDAALDDVSEQLEESTYEETPLSDMKFPTDEPEIEDDGFVTIRGLDPTAGEAQNYDSGYVCGSLVKDTSPKDIYMLGAEVGFRAGRNALNRFAENFAESIDEIEDVNERAYDAGFMEGLSRG